MNVFITLLILILNILIVFLFYKKIISKKRKVKKKDVKKEEGEEENEEDEKEENEEDEKEEDEEEDEKEEDDEEDEKEEDEEEEDEEEEDEEEDEKEEDEEEDEEVVKEKKTKEKDQKKVFRKCINICDPGFKGEYCDEEVLPIEYDVQFKGKKLGSENCFEDAYQKCLALNNCNGFSLNNNKFTLFDLDSKIIEKNGIITFKKPKNMSIADSKYRLIQTRDPTLIEEIEESIKQELKDYVLDKGIDLAKNGFKKSKKFLKKLGKKLYKKFAKKMGKRISGILKNKILKKVIDKNSKKIVIQFQKNVAKNTKKVAAKKLLKKIINKKIKVATKATDKLLKKATKKVAKAKMEKEAAEKAKKKAAEKARRIAAEKARKIAEKKARDNLKKQILKDTKDKATKDVIKTFKKKLASEIAKKKAAKLARKKSMKAAQKKLMEKTKKNLIKNLKNKFKKQVLKKAVEIKAQLKAKKKFQEKLLKKATKEAKKKVITKSKKVAAKELLEKTTKKINKIGKFSKKMFKGKNLSKKFMTAYNKSNKKAFKKGLKKFSSKAKNYLKNSLRKIAPKLVKKLGNKFGKFGSKLIVRKAAKKAAIKAAKKGASKAAQKAAAKGATKVAAKAGAMAAKSAAKAGMGPVGWALMAFDVLSLAFDLLGVGGFENKTPTDVYIENRNEAKKMHDDYLKESAEDAKKNNYDLSIYPRIVGPLDKLDEKKFNKELEEYEKNIYKIQKNIYIMEYIENIPQKELIKMIKKYSKSNPDLDYETTVTNFFIDPNNKLLFNDKIEEYIDDKFDKFMENPKYNVDFMKKMCYKNDGKWIIGSNFGKSETSSGNPSTCSYIDKKSCDNSYDWKLIRDEVDPAELKIPNEIKALKKKLQKSLSIFDDLKKSKILNANAKFKSNYLEVPIKKSHMGKDHSKNVEEFTDYNPDIMMKKLNESKNLYFKIIKFVKKMKYAEEYDTCEKENPKYVEKKKGRLSAADKVKAKNKAKKAGEKPTIQVPCLYELFEKFNDKLSELEEEIENYKVEIENEDDDFANKEIEKITILQDLSIGPEMYAIEKKAQGETYAQFYKTYPVKHKNKSKNIKINACLENAWAGSVRASCELHQHKSGVGRQYYGCRYPTDSNSNCVLRYNYNKHVCEPTPAYCISFGEESKPRSKWTNSEGLRECEVKDGQKVFEYIFGTAVTRFGKQLVCAGECCSNDDCIEKGLVELENSNPDKQWKASDVKKPICDRSGLLKSNVKSGLKLMTGVGAVSAIKGEKGKNVCKARFGLGEPTGLRMCSKNSECKPGLRCGKYKKCTYARNSRSEGQHCYTNTDCKGVALTSGFKGSACCLQADGKNMACNKKRKLGPIFVCPEQFNLEAHAKKTFEDIKNVSVDLYNEAVDLGKEIGEDLKKELAPHLKEAEKLGKKLLDSKVAKDIAKKAYEIERNLTNAAYHTYSAVNREYNKMKNELGKSKIGREILKGEKAIKDLGSSAFRESAKLIGEGKILLDNASDWIKKDFAFVTEMNAAKTAKEMGKFAKNTFNDVKKLGRKFISDLKNLKKISADAIKLANDLKKETDRLARLAAQKFKDVAKKVEEGVKQVGRDIDKGIKDTGATLKREGEKTINDIKIFFGR